jgi:hypothetical protein
MKTYYQLTTDQQTVARNKCLRALLEDILDGGIRFNDALNHDDLQARIDAACEKAEKTLTPWFSPEFILDTCREDLEGMAQCEAEDTLYSENERVMSGVA